MKPTVFFCCLILMIFSSTSYSQLDEPDYKKEEQFFQIYKNFNQTPVSDDQWNQIVKSSQVRVYEILNQDTLWDISEVLFADPLFWPKIWSLNSRNIYNPHEIKPGWKINFLAGTLFNPPDLLVEPGQDTEPGQEVAPQNFQEFLEKELGEAEIPPGLPVRPVADIPPSLPYYVFRPPPATKVEIVKNETNEISKVPPLPLPVEIFENQPSVSGEIVEFEDEARVASDSRDIYVKLNADLGPGLYTTVKKIERSKFGYVVVYGAEIEAIQRINDSENIYRAKIKKMINIAEINDQVIPGTIPMADVTESELSTSAPLVKIIGGYRSPTDSFYSAYSIVFLNGGITQGLRPGDSLKVYLDPKIRMSKTKIKKAFRSVGTLKVLRSQSNVSTAYVLSSQSELREGDLAGYLPEETNSGSDFIDQSDELTLE